MRITHNRYLNNALAEYRTRPECFSMKNRLPRRKSVNAELPAFFKKLPSRNLLTMKESLPIKIRDSVALVTGANRGLGLAFVEELLTQLADFLQKKPSFRRESYATRTAAQEVHANFNLQVCTCRLKRRLRHPKLRCCLGKFQCFTNRQKVSQMWSHLHSPTPLCRESMATQETWY